MKTKFYLLIVSLFSIVTINAQYKQQEYEKHPLQKIFPKKTFDSVIAKNALATGNATVAGVAFTKPLNGYGFKAPLAKKIYANHITVYLFSYTPYFQEWYNLKGKEENIKKNRIVYMDSIAYNYKLWCETNSTGEFNFPNMKPGKYIILGTLPWQSSGSYDQYTGSGYDNYGGQTDYYQRQYYNISHSDFLMQIIEIPENATLVKVKLK